MNEPKENEMIDWGKIDNVYIPYHEKNKPKFLNVTDEEWIEALHGVRETSSEMDFGPKDSTDSVWTLIYFCAMYFCKGFEMAEVKHGHKEKSNYPTY